MGASGDDDGVIHVRVVCPPATAPELLGALAGDDAVINLVHLEGAARRPDGDVLFFDAAPEAGNRIVDLLRAHDVDRLGSIAIERIDTSLSEAARIAELAEPGRSDEAVLWEDVEARSRDESGVSPSYVALMVVAALIAAVGILVDSPILIVGAMVVGPEFGPISSIVVGLYRRRWQRVRRGLVSLTAGFVAAFAAVGVMAAVVRAAGWVPRVYGTGDRPLTGFISAPDGWAVLVALLAAVAGALSLSRGRSSTLVGVLVSVTTVPALANIAVALVNDRPGEASGALGQLTVNVAVLCAGGALTLLVQRAFLDRGRKEST